MADPQETTIDELMDRIVSKRPGVRYSLLVVSICLIWIAHPPITYIPVFAGLLPTADSSDWSCASQHCSDVVAANGRAEALCLAGDNGLVLNSSDITWNVSRSSFAIDLDLYCAAGGRSTRKTLVSSIYFVGALCGLLTGSYVYDNIGRKRGALFGTALSIGITFAGTFCSNYAFLIVIRLLQGFGNFLSSTGAYVLVMEMLPTKHRNYVNGVTQCSWALGYPTATLIGYFVRDWNYIFLVSSIALLVLSIPLLFSIESPRFYIINHDIEGAKRSIKSLADMNGVEIDFDTITIVDSAQENKREQGFLQQIKEFYQYPKFLLETGIQMFLWFVVAMSYYGFNFGWSSIVPNMYIGYLLAAVGELIAYLGLIPVVQFFGRRLALIVMFVLACVFYLIAIPDVGLAGDWTLESIACLIGLVFITAAFSLIYLYTGELAPTSHRGMVFCMSSSAARVGSFIGPFIFNTLFQLTHKGVPLGILALLTLVCAILSYLLVETGGKSVPSVPADVHERRKDFTYRVLSKG